METRYKCPVCGSTEIYTKPHNTVYSVMCLDCGSFIRNVKYKEMQEINREIDRQSQENPIEGKSSRRRIVRRNNMVKMFCGFCGSMLYSSEYPAPEGQFDLVNAVFCPECGKFLI